MLVESCRLLALLMSCRLGSSRRLLENFRLGVEYLMLLSSSELREFAVECSLIFDVTITNSASQHLEGHIAYESPSQKFMKIY